MEGEHSRLVPAKRAVAIDKPLVPKNILEQIRPEWQAKNLIQRVVRLIDADASSAVQRLFNAAIHDLRQKIVLAGLDIAKEAATAFKLPPVTQSEDIIENYPVDKIITLAYRMGMLTRPEWRRISRCYEIRRDLEHEDDQYEAEIEDIIYVFKGCIEVILSRDPIELMRVSDIDEIINEPQRSVPSEEFLHDFEIAPDIRQKEIISHLVRTALNSDEVDIIRQNSVEILKRFSSITRPEVKIDIAKELQERIGKKEMQLIYAKVAFAAGVLPYLKQRQTRALFQWLFERFVGVGHHWMNHTRHREIFEDFEDIGGYDACPDELLPGYVEWMTLCYVGEPGGYGDMGRRRQVFYSNVASPRIERLFEASRAKLERTFENVSQSKVVQKALKDQFISRRLEKLVDIVSGSTQTSLP